MAQQEGYEATDLDYEFAKRAIHMADIATACMRPEIAAVLQCLAASVLDGSIVELAINFCEHSERRLVIAEAKMATRERELAARN